MRWLWLADLLTPALSLVLFLSLALNQLELPGLYYDEALDAVPAMQLVLGQKLDLVRNAGLHLNGLTFPLMSMDYVGPVNTYLLVPVFATLGVGVFGLRLMTVLLGALTILLYYFFLRGLFNRGVAAIAVLLLAVHPSFVFWSRQGIHVTSVLTAIAGGSLLCLLYWRRTGRAWLLWLGCFLLGLGITAKILFIWYVLALGLAWLILFAAPRLGSVALRGLIQARFVGGARASAAIARLMHISILFFVPLRVLRGYVPRAPGTRALRPVAGAAFLALGASPLIAYNVQTQGTLEVLAKNFFVSQYGISNFAILDNLVVRLDAFRVLLQGSHFWFLGGLQINRLYPIAFIGSLTLLGVVLLLSREARRGWRKVLFLPLMIGLFLVQSVFTISSLEPTHLLVLLPLPQAVVGLVTYLTYRHSGLGRAGLAAGLAIVAILLTQDVQADLGYHKMLARSGGVVTHSDAVYRLAHYLDELGGEPLALDWGIRTSVQVLTQGRINPQEVFFFQKETPPMFVDWMYGYMTREPQRRYVFHADDMTVFPRRAALLALVEKIGKTAVLEQEIRQQDGRPVFLVYRID